MDFKVRGRPSIRSPEKPISKDRIELEEETERDDDTISHSSFSEDDAFMTDQSQDQIQDPDHSPRCSVEKSESEIKEKSPSSPKKEVLNTTAKLNTTATKSSFEDKNKSINTIDKRSNNKAFVVAIITVLIAVIAGVVGLNTKEAEPTQKIKDCNLKDDLIKTDSDIWINLKSGINEVKNMNKPSVFLYIYNNAPEDYIDDIVNNLSAYAICSLNGTDNPIELTNTELNSSRAHSNYGHIIDKYRNELVLKKVMVVRHLEQVPGVVAQVFHSFCDEVTPLVANSLFLFTMKVDNLKDAKSDYRIVEEVLRRNWSELDDDIFDPLLTRLSNMILRINKSPTL